MGNDPQEPVNGVQFSEEAENAFQVELGRLVMVWGPLELFVDGATLIVFKRFSGNTLEPTIPTSFSKKIKFLKSAFAKLPPLMPLERSTKPVLSEAMKLANERNFLIHGLNLALATHYDKVPSEFLKLAYGTTSHSLEKRRYTTLQIRQLSDRIASIGDLIRFLSDGLLALSMIVNNQDNALSKFQ
jgi:hypothetical protein